MSVKVENGKKDTISVIAENPVYLFSHKNQKRSVEIDFIPDKGVKAPVYKGGLVGRLSVYENGVEIASVKVLANEDVLEKTYFDCIFDIAENWALI